MSKGAWILAVAVSVSTLACGGADSVRSNTDARTESATAAPAATGARAPRGARPRIVFLGDSLTAGLGLPPEESVPALIQKQLDDERYDYEVVNAGVSGDTSAGGLSRLDWSLDGDVRVLVIELGANDGLRGLPPAALKKNLGQIVTRAKQRGIKVLLTGMEAPPNYGADYTAQFRQVYRELAREHGVALMPFYLEGVAGVDRLNQGDRIHPNSEGSRVIARAIWTSLEPLLDDRD